MEVKSEHPPIDRREFFARVPRILAVAGVLSELLLTGCRDGSEPRQDSFEDLVAALKREPTLELFSAVLAKEQARRLNVSSHVSMNIKRSG